MKKIVNLHYALMIVADEEQEGISNIEYARIVLDASDTSGIYSVSLSVSLGAASGSNSMDGTRTVISSGFSYTMR